jgi:hypothetical protein
MKLVRLLRDIFDDWLTRAAGIIFLLIVALIVFNIKSNLPERFPLFGVVDYFFVFAFFVAGGIIFIWAILRS